MFSACADGAGNPVLRVLILLGAAHTVTACGLVFGQQQYEHAVKAEISRNKLQAAVVSKTALLVNKKDAYKPCW